EVARGRRQNKPAPDVPLGEGSTGWVALHGQPLMVSDAHKDPRYLWTDPEIRSEIVVPLRADDGHIMGVVSINSTRPKVFRDEHLKLLSFLTMEASRAINRIWHIQQLTDKATHLETLLTIARSIVVK